MKLLMIRISIIGSYRLTVTAGRELCKLYLPTCIVLEQFRAYHFSHFRYKHHGIFGHGTLSLALAQYLSILELAPDLFGVRK